jgi:serine/threonine protein kinase
VAFLHKYNVAHRDLKPENVVVGLTSSPQLFIIDFDLAIKVDGEKEMSLTWCGTPPWIAPELGTQDKPVELYSPMLADRWACGRMVKHFAKYFGSHECSKRKSLLAFAVRLLVTTPKARPSLETFEMLAAKRIS